MAKTQKKWITVLVYALLRIAVVGVLIRQLLVGNYTNVFLCALTLALFMIPSFLEKRLKVEMPDALEIIIILFIFSAEILGEIHEYYLTFKYWDTMLHTINGFIMAAIGFSLIDVLNRTKRFAINLSPIFVALVAFCFSMMIGVMWEFYEYGMDMIFNTDMQKDTWIEEVSSVQLNHSGHNVPITVKAESVTVNGRKLPGYLDIGLIDTMNDLFVNFVGAFIYSLIGYFYIKKRKNKRVVEGVTLVYKDEE